MPLIRVKDLVPDVYESTSRDFQLISNLKTCVFSATKEDIDSIVDIISTEHCPDRLLPLLQSRLGFITDKEFDNRTLRIALSVFPYLIKNKGTLKAIKQAVYAFLKINNLNTRTYVEVNNKVDYGYIKEVSRETTSFQLEGTVGKLPKRATKLNGVLGYVDGSENLVSFSIFSSDVDLSGKSQACKLSQDGLEIYFAANFPPKQDSTITVNANFSDLEYVRKYADNKQPYTIKIGIESTPRDITILKELFKYILPPGYDISFFFFSGVDEGLTTDKFIFNDSAEIITVSDGINSQLLSYSDGTVEGNEWDSVGKHLISAGDTFETITYSDSLVIDKDDNPINQEIYFENKNSQDPPELVKTKAKRGRKKKVNKDAN